MIRNAVRNFLVLGSLVSFSLVHLLWPAQASQPVELDAKILDTFVSRNIGPANKKEGIKKAGDKKVDLKKAEDKDQKKGNDQAGEGDKNKDRIALQGGWKVLSAELDGKPLPDTKEAMLVITEDLFTLTPKGGAPKAPVKIALDATKQPPWFDIDIGPGIYFLHEDTLKLCFGKEGRPTEFTSQSARYLLILEREICAEAK